MRLAATTPALLPAGELGRALRLRIALEVVMTGLWVRWLVRRRELVDVVSELRDPDAEDVDPELSYEIGRRLRQRVKLALDPVPGDSRCLTRSLVLIRMLARRGVTAELVVGVAHESGFESHAWVEHQGRELTSSLRFNPMIRL